MKNSLVGLLLLLLGALFLLNNTGFIEIEIRSMISTYWPALLILWGIYLSITGFFKLLISIKRGFAYPSPFITGLIVTGIGIIFQGNRLGYFEISFANLWSWIWPLLIIYIGFQILFNRRNWYTRIERDFSSTVHSTVDDIDPEFDDMNSYIFGNVRRRKQWLGEMKIGATPWELDDMQVWQGVGDLKLDLTKAILVKGESYIDLSGWIGEITVKIPRDMPIKVQASTQLGEVSLINNDQSGATVYNSFATDDYEFAEQKVKLNISLIVGQITVKRVD
ncbi:cell wall-active antibiotics response protein LiaF [Caldalkalibacillus mannanilyticus]|uniref:cell wall-active antibiotics response protein LiaF n=1 Tax=Caldalkalibacillus mannanilyticus TaxID=1418 RepID=UPI00046A93BE|nr:cell wall-active antibiotics response protein LiaF [Caldalkalibacillus mannanilyticus]